MKRDHVITDSLERAEDCYHLHTVFERAFAFLRQDALAELPSGRHEIDGDRLFCVISKGPGRSRAEAKLEAHRKYIDIQYVMAGTDEMGTKPTADCQLPDTGYDAENDIEFFRDEPGSWTKVRAGSFIVFFPEDAHAPLVSTGEIHKAVLKVAIE
jgi:YhcH/YjgK/YiaL family protein